MAKGTSKQLNMQTHGQTNKEASKQAGRNVFNGCRCFSDGGCFSDVRGPLRTNNPQQSQTKEFVLKTFTLLGRFWTCVQKCEKRRIFPIYRKYNESKLDIQNNNLLYRIHHKCQNTFQANSVFEH